MKKILFSAMAILLSLGLMGGAFAYFSDTETSSGNTMTAGTLDMQIANSNPNWGDGVIATWASPPNWAPGDTVEATLRITNIGSIGSKWLWFKTVNVNEYEGNGPESEPGGSPHDIANHIFIKDFRISWNGVDWSGNWAGDSGWMTSTWGPWSTEGPLTLAEFASTPFGVLIWEGAWEEGSGGLLLADGANVWYLKMILQFDPDADNNYQSDYCTFDFGVKTWNGPATGYPVGTFSPEGYGYGDLQ